jgi:hypothetical protein
MPYEARDRHICDHKGPEETIAGRVISALQGADVSQLFECAANRCLPTPGHQDLDTLSEPGRVRSKNSVGLLMTLG